MVLSNGGTLENFKRPRTGLLSHTVEYLDSAREVH